MAGTITHSWKGTVLTITSDAGTSSADLAGATGCRGPQGRPGVVYDNEGKMLIADLASLEYVDAELAKYDNKSLIRDKDGNLRTAVGGEIIEKIESEVVASTENVAKNYASTGDNNYMIFITTTASTPPVDVSLLTEGARYNVYMTLSNGAMVEFNNVKYYADGRAIAIADNEYATEVKFTTQAFMVYTSNIDLWNNVNISLFEVKVPGYCIYNPIDARALAVDGDNITINIDGQLTVGSNVVVESRMAEYVGEQIDLAKVGGDDPAAVLANYYTKAEIDAKFAAILNSEEVDY